MRATPSVSNSTGLPLQDLPRGDWASVESVELPEQEGRWLAAMGVYPGASVTVLRRAALGGPLHVRTASGGAFALGVDLARRVRVGPRRAAA